MRKIKKVTLLLMALNKDKQETQKEDKTHKVHRTGIKKLTLEGVLIRD
jgi:hypothetical protein